MRFEPRRLRSGELIAGASAIVLLVVMLVFPWYGLKGVSVRNVHLLHLLHISTSITGYHEYIHLRWLLLVTIAAALALVYLQGTRRAPALPSAFSMIATVLGALTSAWLIYRVIFNVPGSNGLLVQKPAAYVGLASALALTYGAFRSLREEDRPDPARNAAIPTVPLEHGR